MTQVSGVLDPVPRRPPCAVVVACLMIDETLPIVKVEVWHSTPIGH